MINIPISAQVGVSQACLFQIISNKQDRTQQNYTNIPKYEERSIIQIIHGEGK